MSGSVSSWKNLAAMDVNDASFDTSRMYSIGPVTPLRLPAFSVNCGTMPLRVTPFDGDTRLGGSSTTGGLVSGLRSISDPLTVPKQ